MKQWLNSKQIKRTKEVEEVVDVDILENEILIVEKWIQEYTESFNLKIGDQQKKLNELKALRDELVTIPDRPEKEVEAESIETKK